MAASGALTVASRDAGASRRGLDGYESVWNGRDELVHRPSPPAPRLPAKLSPVCWRLFPLGDFDRRRILPTLRPAAQGPSHTVGRPS